ncbi:MAG: alpha/beta hydrolase, partial [Clostridia bacterium]|nr:alpha/beta hydrolase [Clostridia bacterium]
MKINAEIKTKEIIFLICIPLFLIITYAKNIVKAKTDPYRVRFLLSVICFFELFHKLIVGNDIFLNFAVCGFCIFFNNLGAGFAGPSLRSCGCEIIVKTEIYVVPTAVLIDIHGGGFISHDKSVDSVFANVMAQKGFVVFALNYRLAYPEYNVFDQIEDIDKAARWIVEHASSYEGDNKR